MRGVAGDWMVPAICDGDLVVLDAGRAATLDSLTERRVDAKLRSR